MTEESEKLTTTQSAERAGISRKTWNAYVSRGQGPAKDGEYDKRTPWWYATTVDAWAANRPGQGGPGKPRPRKAPNGSAPMA